MTAKFIKVIHKHVNGESKLYKLSSPINEKNDKKYNYVVVSAAIVSGSMETYIFGSNKNGKILSWTELNGSFKGVLDHEQALNNAGYEVKNGRRFYYKY